jgi:uncharacterized protein YjeT (DUF2065 family)
MGGKVLHLVITHVIQAYNLVLTLEGMEKALVPTQITKAI